MLQPSIQSEKDQEKKKKKGHPRPRNTEEEETFMRAVAEERRKRRKSQNFVSPPATPVIPGLPKISGENEGKRDRSRHTDEKKAFLSLEGQKRHLEPKFDPIRLFESILSSFACSSVANDFFFPERKSNRGWTNTFFSC